METYCLIVKNSGIVAITDFYRKVLNLSADEAVLKIKRTRNVVFRNLILDKACAYAEASRKNGIETMIIPASEIPVLPESSAAKKMRMGDTGFSPEGDCPPVKIPFEKIYFISACLLEEETPSAEELAKRLRVEIEETAYPNALKRKKDYPVKKEVVGRMDLFTDGAPFRIGMRSDDFDFSCLEREKTFSSGENFKRLLCSFAGLSLKARLSPSAEGLIKGDRNLYLTYSETRGYENEIAGAMVCRGIKIVLG